MKLIKRSSLPYTYYFNKQVTENLLIKYHFKKLTTSAICIPWNFGLVHITLIFSNFSFSISVGKWVFRRRYELSSPCYFESFNLNFYRWVLMFSFVSLSKISWIYFGVTFLTPITIVMSTNFKCSSGVHLLSCYLRLDLGGVWLCACYIWTFLINSIVYLF